MLCPYCVPGTVVEAVVVSTGHRDLAGMEFVVGKVAFD